jgi:hypothetical protein
VHFMSDEIEKVVFKYIFIQIKKFV